MSRESDSSRILLLELFVPKGWEKKDESNDLSVFYEHD